MNLQRLRMANFFVSLLAGVLLAFAAAKFFAAGDHSAGRFMTCAALLFLLVACPLNGYVAISDCKRQKSER